eukprot:m.13892 g.13892  ORF g.13892 m.13892 type:complete len:111 (+) comp4214_c0_seq1:153-485(+)
MSQHRFDESKVVDESVVERLFALSEMFPQSVRNVASTAWGFTKEGTSMVYKYGGKLTWVLTTSALVLFLIPQYEQDQEQQTMQAESSRMQSRQMLTTPVSGPGSLPPAPK